MTNQPKKNKFFISLNAKIFLFLFLSIAGVCSLFLSIFMLSYVEQMDQEAVLGREKAKSLYELYDENMRLRRVMTELYAQINTPETDTVTKLWNEQNDDFHLKPLDDRYFALRQELFRDMKGGKDRSKKVQRLGYFIFAGFLLVLFILELLWLIIGRWVLRPIENLLDATHHISSGDLSFRVPVLSRFSRQDELDLLARDFNQMAENIEKSIQNIKENKEFLQNLINTIPDGIRVLDENYNIILTNLSYDKMNEQVSNLSEKKCFEVCGYTEPCRSEQNPCPLILLKENPNRPVNLMQRYTDKEGREKFMEVSAAASFHQSESGQVLWIIELIRPLDKAILFSHQQKLSAVGMLASSVAHEMRNPLGSVRLILENILDKIEKKPMKQEDLKRYLELINEQISFCINVTSRLLKLSRKPEKEYRPVDLNEVVSETACLLEYEAKKAGIDVKIEESDQPAVISAADAEMRMMTVNLMQNAFHAMPDGGKMTIKIFTDKDRVNVDFADTGVGIAPENLSRIFEPFFSKGVSDTGNTGTGLGLSIVKTIIENCGGTVQVESVVGQGTVFHLSFKACGIEEDV